MKKFKKKIYLGLVVGVSMFGFMAHTKQVTADTWIWVNTSDTICENFFEIPAGEYLIVSTSRQTKTVWPLIEAMKLKPCGNLAKKM